MDASTEQQSIFMLRVRDVRAKTGLSVSKIYELMAAQKFPKPVRLSTRCVGWVEAEVNAWLRARVEERAAAVVTTINRRRRASAA